MLFKEAVSKRIYQLCAEKGYTPNRLAELSAISPATLHDTLHLKRSNPSSYLIYRLCTTLNITMKEFFDNDLFLKDNIDD